TILTLIIGLIIISFIKHRIARWIVTSLIVICVAIFTFLNLPFGGTIDVISEGKQHPAHPSNYETTFFTYGSGDDLHRDEYAAEVTEKTPSVDASHFITNWSNKREKFWGFNQEALPINGRVWMPKGNGDFPVILMVHGNHTMEYFSTDG